jgi:hypothetical protein
MEIIKNKVVVTCLETLDRLSSERMRKNTADLSEKSQPVNTALTADVQQWRYTS